MTSVKTTEKFSVYWNYQVWHLAEGEQVDGGLADYLLATGSPVEEISSGPAVDTDGDGVPDGTMAEILAWVGDDAAKAALALDAESRRGKTRPTLVASLEKVVGRAIPPEVDPAAVEGVDKLAQPDEGA